MAQTENRLSGQNHKNAYSQTRKNKAIRNQITAKNVPQSRPPPPKKRSNTEQINHQNPEKDIKGLIKPKNKGSLTLKNAVRLKIIVTMATNLKNQNR